MQEKYLKQQEVPQVPHTMIKLRRRDWGQETKTLLLEHVIEYPMKAIPK